jgi:hypothetical protein
MCGTGWMKESARSIAPFRSRYDQNCLEMRLQLLEEGGQRHAHDAGAD